MARPITYSKGIRREVMLALGNTAVLPKKSIKHLPCNAEMISRKLSIMQKEGVVGRYKNVYYQARALNEREEYYREMPVGYWEYAEKYIEPARSRIWNGPVEYDRIVKEADTQLFVRSSGIDAYLEEKPPIKEVGMIRRGCAFYNSREIKQFAPKNEHRKYDGSRINGCLIGESGIYPIYNIGSETIEWYKATEERMKILFNRLGANMYRPMNVFADIILYSNPDKITNILNKGMHLRNNVRYKYLQVDFLYEQMLAVPENESGKLLLKIISTEGWENRILDDFIQREQQSRYQTVSVACDGIETTDSGNTYILLFCIPDLNKLSLFSNRARMENDKERFKVYCFEEQVGVIAKELGGYAHIYTVNLKEYYEQYMKDYNEYRKSFE